MPITPDSDRPRVAGKLEARGDELHVSYRAVRETRQQSSDAFTLRPFRVDPGRAVVIDEGGPVELPVPPVLG